MTLWLVEEDYPQFCGLDVLGRALDGVAVLRGKLGDELQQGGALVLHGLSVAAQQGLVLGRQDVDPRLQLREAVSDVVHEQPGVRGGKGVGSLRRARVPVRAGTCSESWPGIWFRFWWPGTDISSAGRRVRPQRNRPRTSGC